MNQNPLFNEVSLRSFVDFGVGHAQDENAGTGCTVIVAPKGAVCGVDVRGGGPATRETDLLKPENMVQEVNAVVLAGGSAFGLEASCGVMDTLANKSIGFSMGSATVPIVTGACLFDLLVGAPQYPDKVMGCRAAENALRAYREQADDSADIDALAPLAMGNVGAGTGATVGKFADPMMAMKSGFGYSCLSVGDCLVAALVAVNAVGSVCDSTGKWIAGVRGTDNTVMEPLIAMAQTAMMQNRGEVSDGDLGAPCENTTLGVVLTNAHLTKASATRVSSMVHDAYARRIKPVHTSNDGDTIFTMASGEIEMTPDMVGIMGCVAMEQAIENAVLFADGAYGLPAAKDL